MFFVGCGPNRQNRYPAQFGPPAGLGWPEIRSYIRPLEGDFIAGVGVSPRILCSTPSTLCSTPSTPLSTPSISPIPFLEPSHTSQTRSDHCRAASTGGRCPLLQGGFWTVRFQEGRRPSAACPVVQGVPGGQRGCFGVPQEPPLVRKHVF